MFTTRSRLKENKRVNGGFWSRLTFYYLRDFLSLGWSRPITHNDCWEPAHDELAANLSKRLEAEWEKEQRNQGEPSLSRAVLRANGKELWTTAIVALILMIPRTVAPFITAEILKWFISGDNDNSVYIYVGLLSLAFVVNGLGWSRLKEAQFVIGHNIRVQLNTLIYKKILRLSPHGFKQTSIGTMVNYVANDTMFYEFAAFNFGLLVSTPLPMVASTVVLIYMAGVPGIIGTVIYLLLFVPGIRIFHVNNENFF